MEDEAFHIVGQIGERHFRGGPLNPDGANGQVHWAFSWPKICSIQDRIIERFVLPR